MTRRVLVVSFILASLPVLAGAQTPTPVGLWRTIDDKTGKERSLVRISESGGVYEGKIEQLMNRQPDDDPTGLCRACEGERKDQPVVGMTIVWGVRQEGNRYAGGEILDPKNGKIYRVGMKVIDGGKKLEVRGFIGISLFGRSQIWLREE